MPRNFDFANPWSKKCERRIRNVDNPAPGLFFVALSGDSNILYRLDREYMD
jgi:hypothetical protein